MKLTFAIVLLVVLWSASAFGLGGRLSAPSLAYRSDLDANQKTEIHKVLKFMKDDLIFIEGSFINEFTHQRLGGTSAQVSRFIDLVKGLGLWKVHVQFRDFGEQKSALTLDQNTSKDYLRLIINSGRTDYLLKDFSSHLPAPQSPQ
jgi:hypothetical protein